MKIVAKICNERLLLSVSIAVGLFALTLGVLSCEKKVDSLPSLPPEVEYPLIRIDNNSRWSVKIGFLNENVHDPGDCGFSGTGRVITMNTSTSELVSIPAGRYFVVANNSPDPNATEPWEQWCWRFGWSNFDQNENYTLTISDNNYCESCIPPAPASNLTATPMSSSRINLTWQDNSNNESGFNIFRRVGSPSGTYSQIATVGSNVTSYQNVNLTSSTLYCYDVFSFNSQGFSPTEEFPVCATTP